MGISTLRVNKQRWLFAIYLLMWFGISGSITATAQSTLSLEIDRSNFQNVTWAADGESVVLADNDDIVIFDTNLNPIDRIPVGYLQEVSLSPDGNYAALARWNGDIELWDATSWTSLATVRSRDAYLKLAEWSPDSTRLAVAEISSSTIEVWDIQTSEIVSEHTILESENIQVAEWSPDSTKLAIGFRSYESNAVVVWDVESQELTTTFNEHVDDVWNIAWHPNGQWIASRDVPFDCSSGVPVSMIWIWDAETGESIKSLRTYHCSENPIAWSPDGQYLAYTAETSLGYYASKITNLRIIELSTGETIAEWEISEQDTVMSIEWQPNGNKILYSTSSSAALLGFINICATPFVGVVNVADGTLTTYHTNQQMGGILDMSWNPDGGLLATAGNDRSIHIWDVHTGEVNNVLSGYPCEIQHIAWSPVSNQLVSSGNWVVYILDTDTGENLYRSEFIWSNVIDSQTLIWNAAGSQILAFDFDGRGRVWDSSLNILYDFEIPFPLENFPQAVYWGENAPMVARGLDPIEIWRVSEQPTLELTLPTGGNIPKSVAWNSDGTLLAVQNENQSINIWNMLGTLVNTITPDYEAGRIMWHPRANYLIVGNGLSLDVYNIMTREVITTLSVSGSLLTWNTDGTNIAGVNPDAIRIWAINPLE